MSLFAFIFGIISTLPISDYDKANESEYETMARREIIAHAIDYAVAEATCDNQKRANCKIIWGKSREELAKHLIAISYSETKFKKNIHEDMCFFNECDYDSKTKTFKAKSLWQIHAGFISKDQWMTIGGTSQESNNLAALTAAKMFSGKVYECRKEPEPFLAGHNAYGGIPCNSPIKEYAKERMKIVKIY
jgi:hypothetical protein